MSVYVLCEFIFAYRDVSLKDTDVNSALFFFFFTGSIFKLSHDLSGIMSIKAILCGDFPLCALLSQRMTATKMNALVISAKAKAGNAPC